MSEVYKPIEYILRRLIKEYLNLIGEKLHGIPIERYYYPFLFIVKNSGKLTQQQLAEILEIDKVTVVRIVDYLEKIEFVKRVGDLNDRRCHRLHATDLGRKHATSIAQAFKDTDELFLKKMRLNNGVSQGEIYQLLTKLKDISGNNLSKDYS
jgi:DNA-binding MarR family transcriptional regulator